ncbi:hypothetical protein Leryth_010257 [Lithospermum erythrorhizon]|uniref:Transmembrane protein n=1 Tax=Lithospermum erythrorhizon TaxID=34254 RepID=A0AAV3NWS8_LITER|nr:hypothetical protein Leryth_010257 [Lithospermum erythrorhizon]
MEGLQNAFRSAISQDPNLSAISSTFEKAKSSFNTSTPSTTLSTDQSQIILSRSSRRVVSLWTCSKLCGFCFIAGIVVGYTLKRRVRRWASKLLRRMKDD